MRHFPKNGHASIFYLSKLNYSLIISSLAAWMLSYTWAARASYCLISLLYYVLIMKIHYYFSFKIPLCPLPCPSSENSQTSPEKYKRTKRQAKRALCSALNHFLSQVQPLCIILPWLIEWVCGDRGSRGGSDGVLSFGLPFLLPVGKSKFFVGIGCLVSFKFYFLVYNRKVIFPKTEV